MTMQANTEQMKNLTVQQAYDLLYRQGYEAPLKQAQTAQIQKATKLAGELTPAQETQIAQFGATHVNVDGKSLPVTNVFAELWKRRGEREVTVGDEKFTVSSDKALDILLENRGKRPVVIDGKTYDLPEEAAAKLVSQREEADRQFGLAGTREERAKRTAELSASTKRIGTILNNYGEAGVMSITPEGILSTGGANKYQELVTKARAGDREAKTDLRAVASDMYSIRAPKGLLPKERFDNSVIELLTKGVVTLDNGKVVKLPKDGTVRIEDEDGVFIKVKMDPSGMIKIVEVIG